MKKIFSILILLFSLSFDFSLGATTYKTLQKYNSLKIYNSDDYVYFDTKDFDEDEEMYFKIKYYDYYYYEENYYHYAPGADLVKDIYYKYITEKDDNFDKTTNTFKTIKVDSTSHSDYEDYSYRQYYGYSYFTKYFIIKKQSGNGDYLIINLKDTFNVYGNTNDYDLDYIENTKENEAKIGMIIGIVVVCVAVVVAVIVIICCCIKRKKQQQAILAQQAAYNAQAQAYPVGAQAYPVQEVTPVYPAQQNYPVPVVENAGYSSNAAAYPQV